MKIRLGFVSNSSSSSFCIYGAFVDEEKIQKLFKEQINANENFDVFEAVIKWGNKNGLITIDDDYSEGWYIGQDPRRIKDSETGKEFKDNVKSKIESLFGHRVKCQYIDGEIGC